MAEVGRYAVAGALTLVLGCSSFAATSDPPGALPADDSGSADANPGDAVAMPNDARPPKPDAAGAADDAFVGDVGVDATSADTGSGTDSGPPDGAAPVIDAAPGPADTGSDVSKPVPGCGPLTACQASCVDTQTDPNNCGSCGHSCGTAGCMLGVCKAEWVVSAAESVDVYSDDTTLWFNRKDAIQRCVRNNCTSATTIWNYSGYTSLPTRFGYVLPTGQAAGTFFFGASSSGSSYMAKCKVTGCIPVNVGPVPSSIAADEVETFFSSGSALHKMPFAGTSSVKFVDLSYLAGNLALSPTSVFWTAMQGGGVYGSARSTASVTTLVSPTLAAGATALALNGTDLYFADNVSGSARILSCPANVLACTPTVLASNEKIVSSIVYHGGYVYWTTSGSSASATGTLRACKPSACAPFTVAVGLANPKAMSTGAFIHMYIAALGVTDEPSSGGIYRIVKPQ